jgi:signal transduction histidine kinase
MEKKPTNINATLKDTLALRIYEQKQQNIQLITQLAPGLPPVLGCGSQLQQVFLNIIINAEFFMTQAHHGGTLTITTEKYQEVVRISIANDGDAIPAENLERIFDPFFTTKDVGQGTGLGLSISYGIITQHNGRIYAESKPGKGVTFIIELPAISRGGNGDDKPG